LQSLAYSSEEIGSALREGAIQSSFEYLG
jgi:hypothetical protein